MKIKTIFEIIKRKGLIDTFCSLLGMFTLRISSSTKIEVLRLRGYGISRSAILYGQNVFFQSEKNSIVISDHTRLGHGVRIKSGFQGKIIIGKSVLIDDNSYVSAHERIVIGDESMIAANVYIVDFNHLYPLQKSKKLIGKKSGYEAEAIVIGRYVWIGANAVILKGVTIGDNAVVGASSVVTKDVPENTVVAGCPAKVIKRINL